MNIYLTIGWVYTVITLVVTVCRQNIRTKLYDRFDKLRELLNGSIIADLLSIITIIITSFILLLLWPIWGAMDIVSYVKPFIKHEK